MRVTNPNDLFWFHSIDVPLPKGPGSVVLMLPTDDVADAAWSRCWPDDAQMWHAAERYYYDAGHSEAGFWWAWLELPPGAVGYSRTDGVPIAEADTAAFAGLAEAAEFVRKTWEPGKEPPPVIIPQSAVDRFGADLCDQTARDLGFSGYIVSKPVDVG